MLNSSILDKKELTSKNKESLKLIESLRRLQYMRRFSKDENTELKLQLSRDTYIETAVNLARLAGYNYRRTMRLAHEVNRSFEVTIEPKLVHEYVDKLLSEEVSDVNLDTMIETFDITEVELIEILGTNADELDTVLFPRKIV